MPETTLFDPSTPVAYFSMEVGLDPAMPTYSGGLGILAGDTLKAAADIGIPMVGVTLLHRKGYFTQKLDDHGNQKEEAAEWSPESFMEPLETRVTIDIQGQPVRISVWRYVLRGHSGSDVPVYFLDTFLPENSSYHKTLTDYLYGGDDFYRLCQEVILGMGGIAVLRALGYQEIRAYHMNEGHSALLGLGLLQERAAGRPLQEAIKEGKEDVCRRCLFTTHTPVPVGHDQFPISIVQEVLGEERANALIMGKCCLDDSLNMTHMALSFSRYINGVAMRHGAISRNMYPNYPINSITNGVHALTWTSPAFSQLFDKHIPEWKKDSMYLRYAISIPLDQIFQAHQHSKQELMKVIKEQSGNELDPKTMTIGFARRAAAYKRGDLIFSDLDRLRQIAKKAGPLQIIYSGKAHPKDEGGKNIIRHIFEAASALSNSIKVVYLRDYNMALGRYLTSGVDLWLNTPRKPHEASGTSGMKAALNGIPSLSVLDGWWIEGHIEGVTGWSIGESWEPESNPTEEISSLYEKLEYVIVPMFYKHPDQYLKIMQSVISINGSFFNAQRMLTQYIRNAYLAI